jgi:hypothetical protein
MAHALSTGNTPNLVEGLDHVGIVTASIRRSDVAGGLSESEETPWRKIASSATRKTSSACT